MSELELKENLDGAIQHYITMQGDGASSCAQSFAFCAASVTASAMAGHLSCAGADLFPAVGILCHASVLALQVIGNQECASSYQDCMNANSDIYGHEYYYINDRYITALF